MKESIWDHNLAYNSWINKQVKNRNEILDVGCGKGYLDFYLYNSNRHITGIDIDISNIKYDKKKYIKINFIEDDFLCHDFKKKKFDAKIFVASIHHMDERKALEKAKRLLNTNGVIIIVGLSKPSSILDYLIEIGRIIPCKVISKIKKMQTSEDLKINVNYNLSSMQHLKRLYTKEIPGYKLRYGLYYRYLLYWVKY